MRTLYHSITDMEFKIIHFTIMARTFKLDVDMDEVIDLLHDSHIRGFQLDSDISESEIKKEYPISEIFTVSYFLGASTRSASKFSNQDYFIEIMHKFIGSLCKKFNGHYSFSFENDRLELSISIPKVDFEGLDLDDRNYPLYKIYESVRNTDADKRKDINLSYESDNSFLSRIGYVNGNLILNLKMNIESNPMSYITKLFEPLFRDESIRAVILNEINKQ